MSETGIFEFTPESLKGKFFIDKKFKNDQDYKSSILECIRLVTFKQNSGISGIKDNNENGKNGDVFSDVYMDLLKVHVSRIYTIIDIFLYVRLPGRSVWRTVVLIHLL